MRRPHDSRSLSMYAHMVVMTVAGLLVLLAPVRGQDDVLDPPPVDAVTTSIVHEYILLPDGSTTYTCEQHLKHLSNFSFSRAYGETFIVYDPAWQTLKIDRCTTTMANGVEVKAPFNAFNEVLPGFAANAAPYSRLREMVVTHTGLERNAVTHLKYTITTKPGMLPGLMGKVLFGDRSPIEVLTVRVKVPKSASLTYCSVRDSIPPRVVEEGDWNVYEWKRRDLPLMSVEANQTPMDQFIPSLHFTTASEAQISGHVLGDIDKLLKANPAMTNLAAALVKNATTPYEKAIALRNHVESNVGLMGGDPIVTGFRPMTAEVTFARNVGSALDRTVLLTALCKAAGFDASVALCHVSQMASVHSRMAEISSTNNFRKAVVGERIMLPDLASYHVFSTPAVFCPGIGIGGSDLLLDPNSEQHGNRSARTDNRPFLILQGNRRVLPSADDIRNRISIRNELTIDEQGNITGSVQCASSGRARFSFRDEKDRFMKGIRKSMSRVNGGMTVKDEQFNVSDDGTAQCSFTTGTQRAVGAVGSVRTIRLPTPPGSLDDYHLIFPSYDRYTDYEMPPVTIEQCVSIVKIPKGYTVAIAKPVAEVSNLMGDVTCSARLAGDELRIERQIIVYDQTPSAGHYHSARHLFNAWYHPSFSTITLVKE